MTCYVGEGMAICTGRSGDWRVTQAWCPWCCCVEGETVPALSVPIFGGYCGMEYRCGNCGFAWAVDDYWTPTMDPHDQDLRDKHIALVAEYTA